MTQRWQCGCAEPMNYPERIVCLTEETVETLYLIGEGDRVVGVSGYTVRPPEARKKPKVSAFINARYDKIEALRPDLILAFSDLQADIAAELIRRGYNVVTFNQRSVDEILQMIVVLGRIVGRGGSSRGTRGRARCRARRDPPRERRRGSSRACSSRSGISRSSRAFAGSTSSSRSPAAIRSSLSCELSPLAKDRIVNPDDGGGPESRRDLCVVVREGHEETNDRRTPGWQAVNAVRHDRIYEIKSTLHPAARTGVAHRGRAAASGAHRARQRSGRPSYDLIGLRMRLRNSLRVRASSRNDPSIALVTAVEFCFCTPRIDMQR